MSRVAMVESQSAQLARELAVSQRLIEVARRIGLSLAQARELAVWFSLLTAEERAALVVAASRLPAKSRPGSR